MLDDRLIARISELYYLYDIDQYEIAKRFNFSKTKICRIIKEAKRRGIVKFTIKSFDKRNIELEKKLEKKYGLKEAIIYFNAEGNKYDENLVFQEIGVLGANYFKRILKDRINIALTWGKTLYYLIKNIDVDRKFDVNFFSSLGGVSLTKSEYQNNNLIQMLCETIGGTCYPLYFPLVLEKEVRMENITANYNIDMILGDTSKIDYYFAGLGSISKSSRMYTLGGFDKKFLDELTQRGICGEIGLNFYNIDGQFVDTSIDKRVVNLSVEDIKKIKYKVIVTFGKSKIKSLKGFLNTKIADVLITDSTTATSLIN